MKCHLTGACFEQCGSGSNISGAESLTVTQQSHRKDSLATCGIVVGGDGCKTFYFELRIDSGGGSDGDLRDFLIGAVRQGIDHNEDHYDSNDAWYLNMIYGSLFGNGKMNSDEQGRGSIKVGDRVGVLIDTEGDGRVVFFKNGKKFGPGFSGGVKGKLLLGVQTYFTGCQVTLLPGATVPTEPFTEWR